MKYHPKPLYSFYETSLPKAVVGYRIERDLTTEKFAVTLFWHDFYGFTGIGITIEDAIHNAIANRKEFLHPTKPQRTEVVSHA